MEKDQNQIPEEDKLNNEEDLSNSDLNKDFEQADVKNETKELTLDEKIKDLEDKNIRAIAEMENQRRRFEKEKIDAFDFPFLQLL